MKNLIKTIRLSLRNVAMVSLLVIAIVHLLAMSKEVDFIKTTSQNTAVTLSDLVEDSVELNDLIGLNVFLHSIKGDSIATLIFTPAKDYKLWPNRLQIGENVTDSLILRQHNFDYQNNGHSVGSIDLYLDLEAISKTVFVKNIPLYVLLLISFLVVFTASQYKMASTLINISNDVKSLEGKNVDFIKFSSIETTLMKKGRNNLVGNLYVSILESLFSMFQQRIEADRLEIIANERIKLAKLVSHDIRSPLEALKSNLNSEDLVIQKSLDRIESIANDLLDSERDQEPLTLIDLEECLNQIIQEKLAVNSQLDICFDHNIKNAFVKSNSTALKRVFSNLLNNSIEAIAEDGKIEISLLQRDQSFEIILKDSGKGVDESIIKKLNMGLPVTSGKSKGSGLGFSSSFELLKNWGGQLKISSQKSTGTIVSLTLPLALESRPKHQIVHLDDDELTRMNWQLASKKDGIPLISLSNKEELDKILKDLPRETLFYIDHELNDKNFNGADICNELIVKGFKNLHLSTGHSVKDIVGLSKEVLIVGKRPPKFKEA